MGLPGCSQPETGLSIKPTPVCADDWAVDTTLSCGECGAPLRPEQDWCSLCYAAVKPVFDPLTAPLDDVMDVAAGLSAPSEPESAADPEPVSGPELMAEAVLPDVPPEPDEPDEEKIDVSDVDVMLSMLAAEHRRSEPASGLAERLGDRSTRIAVMVGGMVVVGAVLFAVLTALGALV